MERDRHSTARYPPPGGLIRLRARLTNVIVWLGPAWASLCGVVASGGFGWQGVDFLRLALLILLVDGGWGTLWAALGGTDWATPLRRWREWQAGKPIARLPYTIAGSPGNHVSRWLGQLRSWWGNVLWPACGPAISAIAVALPVTGVMGTALGPTLLLLSAAALAVMQLGVAWDGARGRIAPAWDAIVAVGLPWLAGHLTFGSLRLGSAGLAALFVLAWGGAGRPQSRRGRVLGIGGQLLAGVVLIAARRPLAGGAVSLLLFPQVALLPWLGGARSTAWYTRHIRPWLMTAMLLAAWAL